MLVLKRLAAVAAAVIARACWAAARLSPASGSRRPGRLGFQQSATPVMDNIVWFHDFLLWLITAITLFVLALLVIVIVRFNARANPIAVARPRTTRCSRWSGRWCR